MELQFHNTTRIWLHAETRIHNKGFQSICFSCSSKVHYSFPHCSYCLFPMWNQKSPQKPDFPTNLCVQNGGEGAEEHRVLRVDLDRLPNVQLQHNSIRKRLINNWPTVIYCRITYLINYCSHCVKTFTTVTHMGLRNPQRPPYPKY